MERAIKYFYVLTILLFAINANALQITPDLAVFSGIDPKNPDTEDMELITDKSPLELLYKNDVAEGDDQETSFWNNYTTTYYSPFPNPSTDPLDANIAYTTGSFINYSPTFLLVKDGVAHDPIWYIFNLTNLFWNGTDTLELRGFWPGGGAISHVAIYGGEEVPNVPEPTTMLLFGTGIAGLAAVRRRRNI